MKEYTYYIYITTNRARRPLYTGVTNNLLGRVCQHKEKILDGFTKQYNCNRLVYYEEFEYIEAAIAREKQIKNWNRQKKIQLIERMNPKWKDLYEELKM